MSTEKRWPSLLAELPQLVIAISVGVLLWQTFMGRVGYPYDLEWMEGGMLLHGVAGPPGAGAQLARKRGATRPSWRTRSAGRPTGAGGTGAQPAQDCPGALSQEMARAPGEAPDMIFDCTGENLNNCSIAA